MSFSPEGSEHDWYWLLDRFGILGYDLRIAAAIRRSSALLLLGSFVAGVWLCLAMIHRPEVSSTPETAPETNRS